MAQQGMPFESRYLRVRDHRIHYRTIGEGETVLLIHGIPTSSFMWRQIAPLLGLGYHVLAPDMLGYGKSDKPQDVDVSVSAQADLMAEFLDQVSSDSAAVVGHGIGGAVAQIMAVRYPEHVSRLVLLNTACYDAWPAAMRDLQNPKLEKTLSVEKLEGILERHLSQGVYHQERMSDSIGQEYLQPWTDPWGMGALLQDARALDPRETMEIATDLKRLDVPVLILWGREDPWLKPKLAERLHREIRGSELKILTQAGHYINEDAPERVAESIRQFLRFSAIARIPQLEPVTA